ncbi:MAG TPA: DUF177 domain-containing protein [Longimicrobiaceae bacterium]
MPILNLADVARGEARVEGQILPSDPLWEGSEVKLEGPLRVDLRAQSVGEGVLVRGEMKVRLALECRRCLEPVVRELDDEVTLLFEPLNGEEVADLEGEVYPLPARGDYVDLGPPLREELILRLLDYVVCSESCRGLCPKCGANLNDGTCDCVPEEESSPWSALKKLKFD